MVFEEMKLADGRKVIFEPKESLLVLKKAGILVELLPSLKEYLNYFMETIYVENEEGYIEGILTSGDVAKSIAFGEVFIQQSFFQINNTAKITESYFTTFFNEHANIRSLPLIISGNLYGQFTVRYSDSEKKESSLWNEIESEIACYLHENLIRDVVISSDEENKELCNVIKRIPDIKIHSKDVINHSFVHLYSNQELRKYLRECLKNPIRSSRRKYISLQDMYMECLIRHCMETFERNHVKVLYFEAPRIDKIHNIGEELKRAAYQNISIEDIKDNESLIREIYQDNESGDYVRTGEFHACRYLDQGNYCNLADYSGKYLNIIDGKRATLHIPESYQHSVWFFGTCIARGAYVSDAYTIESQFQEMINHKFPNKYRMVNCGVAGRVGNEWNDFHYMMDMQFRQRDFVICIAQYSEFTINILKKCGVPIYETSHLFEQPNHLGRWFLDNLLHVNHKANKVIAEMIDQILEPFFYEKDENGITFRLSKSEDIDQSDYKYKELIAEYIKEVKKAIHDKWENMGTAFASKAPIGAVVMNCNPFTLGHRYLIEESAKKVSLLICFVVQEDKSVFPFKDRIKLVKEGTKDLKNVLVLPGGKFMISTETFPEYFNKNHLQEMSINTTKDVRIFGKYIAPALEIKKRFVGTEPNDTVTEIYNRTLAEILPKYGIELIEIQRKQLKDEVISASYVRRLLQDGELDKIKDFVPETTYHYLRQLMLHI